ncbi:MAG: glutamate racemase [Elusimicrobiota bacterium]|nr:glutamate racemase [Elusimicrobiota bacterium]
MKKIEGFDDRPIGIFDSGFGGLTVMAAVNKMLPNESLIYFGDTAHLPYGSKSKEAITKFSTNIADFLVSKGIKALVVACNTASAFALPAIKKNLQIPVVGVIEPGAKEACKQTISNRIGVIGTEGTISSNSYKKAVRKFSKAIVFGKPCPLFVPLVEEGWTKTQIALDAAKIYLDPLIKRQIDALILGCTHYPLLKSAISKTVGPRIKLVDSANAVACEVTKILNKGSLNASKGKKGTLSFYASDNPKKFQRLGGEFFGKKLPRVKKIILE